MACQGHYDVNLSFLPIFHTKYVILIPGRKRPATSQLRPGSRQNNDSVQKVPIFGNIYRPFNREMSLIFF